MDRSYWTCAIYMVASDYLRIRRTGTTYFQIVKVFLGAGAAFMAVIRFVRYVTCCIVFDNFSSDRQSDIAPERSHELTVRGATNSGFNAFHNHTFGETSRQANHHSPMVKQI